MASANTLFKKILNVKDIVVKTQDFYTDKDGVKHLRIYARPTARKNNCCPFCGKKSPRYDLSNNARKVWRGLDWGGIIVEIECPTHRVKCEEHGVVTADVPWAYPGSSFTKEFDLTVAWLATYLPRSAVSNYMRIDWATVGRCISRTLNDIEPERSRRLNGLVNIGIDETSYKKGHKYITVVVNHDTNTVVWIGEVRREVWREAYTEAQELSKANPRGKGRPRADDPIMPIIKAAQAKADEIKNSSYALGKAPENLTEKQQLRIELIAATNNKLYRAYKLKEKLRLLLKIKDLEEAETELRSWLWWASHCRIPAFVELNKKIRRHKEHILNTIRLGLSNARIEATNNKIKLIVRKAYGFRNMQNMMDMIYLVCSDLVIPLPNRKSNSAQSA